MGTDINFYIERKVDGKWCEVEVPECLVPDDRDSKLFSYLSELLPERDMPKGVSLDKAIIGDYGFSYFYLDEIFNKLYKIEPEFRDRYFFIFFEHVLPRLIFDWALEENDDGYRDVRIIFGFDS